MLPRAALFTAGSAALLGASAYLYAQPLYASLGPSPHRPFNDTDAEHVRAVGSSEPLPAAQPRRARLPGRGRRGADGAAGGGS